jgi:hypothetical protein
MGRRRSLYRHRCHATGTGRTPRCRPAAARMSPPRQPGGPGRRVPDNRADRRAAAESATVVPLADRRSHQGTSAALSASPAFTVIPRCSPPDLVRLRCGKGLGVQTHEQSVPVPWGVPHPGVHQAAGRVRTGRSTVARADRFEVLACLPEAEVVVGAAAHLVDVVLVLAVVLPGADIRVLKRSALGQGDMAVHVRMRPEVEPGVGRHLVVWHDVAPMERRSLPLDAAPHGVRWSALREPPGAQPRSPITR